MTPPATDRPTPTSSIRLRQAAAEGWLGLFFFAGKYAPFLLTLIRPLALAVAFHFSRSIRRGTLANARRLLGPSSAPAEQNRLARQTLKEFYLCCADIARQRGYSLQQLQAQIESVRGEDLYRRARAANRGAIIVTAHMGSFEVAMAALRSYEEHIHVLFRRDASNRFDAQRSQLRRQLGVNEVAIDDGWTVWMRLREALLADQVVVIQADRILPGQKGQMIKVCDAEMELPPSPIMLAMASGSPIIPIFCVRTPAGKIHIMIQEPITVAPDSMPARGVPHPALLQLAKVIEEQIVPHPEQWHVLEPAWKCDK